MKEHVHKTSLITKLTALWAVSESGLGGIFHALKLPFSGLILGSFAVFIVTYIALNSTKKFTAILQATLIVILIKAIASPHSPFTAYIAVFFQGIVGAMMYSVFKVNTVSSLIYAVLALVESAVQKLLMMVLIFGNTIWEAFTEFFNSLSKELHLEFLNAAPVFIVSFYVVLYVIGGIIAGIFAIKLPTLVQKELKENSAVQYRDVDITEIPKKRKRKVRFFSLIVILIFMMTVFIFSGSFNKALYALLRTFAALFFMLYVINPLFTYFLNRWISKKKKTNHQEIESVIHYVPEFKLHAKTALSVAEQEKSMLSKIRKFLLVWLSLSLHNEKSL